MPNGNMLSELQDILSERNKIDSDVAVRLTLSAIAEVLKNQAEHANEEVDKFAKIEANLKHITSNPAIKAGDAMGRNPKVFGAIVTAFLTILITPHIADVVAIGKALLSTFFGLSLP